MIFSIAMDANYTFYEKSIETHVRAFLPLNIAAVSSVPSSSVLIELMSIATYGSICKNFLFFTKFCNVGISETILKQ